MHVVCREVVTLGGELLEQSVAGMPLKLADMLTAGGGWSTGTTLRMVVCKPGSGCRQVRWGKGLEPKGWIRMETKTALKLSFVRFEILNLRRPDCAVS